MAAIAGIVSADSKAAAGRTEEVEEMLLLMRHRGPDNMVVRTLPEGQGAIGAIEINLTPERTSCAAVVRPPYIVFDGELFNDRAQGQTDIELFLEYYQKHGKKCFTLLDGSYVCAIVDNDEVVLARDQVGSRPLFYWQEEGIFYFSTEMKGLIEHCRYDIIEIPPCHIYSTKDGLKKFAPFVADVPEPGDDLGGTAKILRELLIEAVQKRMVGVKAVSLSGGLDSSIVAAIAKQYNPNLKLFTGTIDSAPGPDLENAILMAKFLGLDHHIHRITDQELEDIIPDAIWHLESFDEDCISGIISN